MFKTIKTYIKISRNKVEVINLETGESASRTATEPFSAERNLVANFHNASETVNAVLKDLGILKPVWRSKVILIQQIENIEGGLNDIEKRALRDLGEMANAKAVYLVEHDRPLTINEALLALEKK